MRLESDQELKEEAYAMLLKTHYQLGTGLFPPSINDLSRSYVKSNQNRFKYPDDVTAYVMASFIFKKGYVEKLTDDNGRTYHLLTDKGKDFVKK